MLTKIWEAIKHNPSIINATMAFVATVLVAVFEVIQLNGGEYAVIAGAIAAQAGFTWSKVTPVD